MWWKRIVLIIDGWFCMKNVRQKERNEWCIFWDKNGHFYRSRRVISLFHNYRTRYTYKNVPLSVLYIANYLLPCNPHLLFSLTQRLLSDKPSSSTNQLCCPHCILAGRRAFVFNTAVFLYSLTRTFRIMGTCRQSLFPLYRGLLDTPLLRLACYG